MSGIQDVAKRAGVSIGTVSRVLNRSGYASEEARAKVEQAVRELNYRPNELARNLLQNRSMTVAMIVPDVANPYFSELVSACERELRNHGYKTMLCETNSQKTNEQTFLDMLDRNMVDGILTCTHSLNHERYKAVNGAIVSFDTMYIKNKIARVTVNHGEGGVMAAHELLRAGCRKVLQFRDRKTREAFPFFERHEEFERVVTEAGAECINVVVKWNEFDENYYQNLVRDCYLKYPDVTGVFGTDSVVLHYMKHVRMMGRRVPQDVRFVAFDGTKVLEMSYPTVTAVRQPIRKLAAEGVNLLIRKMQHEEIQNDQIVLPVAFSKGISSMTDEEYEQYRKEKHHDEA